MEARAVKGRAAYIVNGLEAHTSKHGVRTRNHTLIRIPPDTHAWSTVTNIQHHLSSLGVMVAGMHVTDDGSWQGGGVALLAA